MDTATLKEEGVDIATEKIIIVDTAMSKHRYSNGKFILLPILHQKVWNVENLRGKIHAFVLVAIPLSNQLLWGSHGTPHNDFLGWTQVIPMIKVVKDLCPQRLQMFDLV